MSKLRHICALLFITGLLSQGAAQAPLWHLDIRRNEPNPNTFGQRIANDEARIFFLQEGRVKAVDAGTGNLLWTFQIGRGAQLAYGSGVLVAITARGKIVALEPTTGRLRWTSNKELGIYTVAHKTLYLAGGGKISAVDLETGKVRWSNRVTLFSFAPFEPFTVANGRIFVYSVGGDVVLSATTYMFDERTGKTLGRADTRGPLAIVKGSVYFQNDWFLVDKPDDVFIDIHSLQTGKRLEQRIYSIESRNFPEGGYSGSKVRTDSKAIYISGGGNLACFPLSSLKRKGKPDFVQVPEGDVLWIAGPYRGAFVLEWQKSVWVVQRQREKPCLPVRLKADGYKLAAGHISQVTSVGKNLYIGLKSGTFFLVDTASGRIILRLNLPTSNFEPTRVVGNTFIVQTGATLLAYRLPQLTSP